MAMEKRMTEEEKEHFLKQVRRKGKAMALPAAERERWQEEYDKILAYLRDNYKNFLISSIVRKNRYANQEVFQRFVREEDCGLIQLANQAISSGNAEDLLVYCWLMHIRYMAMLQAEKQEIMTR